MDIEEYRNQQNRTRRIIGDWARFHGFEDDCSYPLISPSDVVLDDLAFRLAAEGELHEIDKQSRERWKTIPDTKGKERRLRRPMHLLSVRELEVFDSLVRGWINDDARIPGGVCYQDVFDLIDKVGGEQPTDFIEYLQRLQETHGEAPFPQYPYRQ